MSSMQSIWGCTGEGGGAYEQICLNQPKQMPSPDSTCELMTSTQHENAVKIDAETWMFQGARSVDLSLGPNLRRRSLYRCAGGRNIRECTPPARGMRASQLKAQREKGTLEREIAPRRRPLPHHPPSPPWPVVRRELGIAAARSWSQAKPSRSRTPIEQTAKKINRGGQEGEGEGEMDAAQGGSTHLGL
ncbi:hypothetical protein PVAP13_4KG298905 [Panicum virgatum]|uniref:Uncharacterized protein n=1 Tax=Panicum virgatum TaxID=38727 RepID=A0A8T0TV18_PANVG|nr:hypothetical protein PVAP13_4KG298905 [Panicum virgatum]